MYLTFNHNHLLINELMVLALKVMDKEKCPVWAEREKLKSGVKNNTREKEWGRQWGYDGGKKEKETRSWLIKCSRKVRGQRSTLTDPAVWAGEPWGTFTSIPVVTIYTCPTVITAGGHRRLNTLLHVKEAKQQNIWVRKGKKIVDLIFPL